MEFLIPRLLLIFLSLEISNTVCQDSVKPHIITILIDDLGWNDVGFHGSNQIFTPNIDALAYSGIILNRHYVLPTCTPSRAALLTGSYPIRTGMQGYPMKCGVRRGIPLSTKLKPEYLKDLGYHTYLVGKWHLGFYTPSYIPSRRGFDKFFGYYNGYIEYFQHGVEQSFSINNISQTYYGFDFHKNDDVEWTWKGKYATSVFTDQARKIIQNHNRSEPLYLLLAHLGVHTGSIKGTGLEVPTEVNVDESYPHIRDRPRRELAGVLEEVDKSVGAITEILQERGMLNNSIILIMSDNGGHTVSTDMQPNWSSNFPLRGMKFTLSEGGVRGAALIWSPLLPKGIITDQFIHITDWLPTFYYAAGGNVSELGKIDGVNQWESLKKMSNVERGHILLNIDEIEGDEGIIIKNRWKVRRGGLLKYANYDYHWGKEENLSPPPQDHVEKVQKSTVARVLTRTGFGKNLNSTIINTLREKSRIYCNISNDIEAKDGYVSESKDFICLDYCIYDIIDDPCEIKNIYNEKILKKAIKLLKKYKKNLRPQEDNSVDPLSDPVNHNGAWMPWLLNHKSYFF